MYKGFFSGVSKCVPGFTKEFGCPTQKYLYVRVRCSYGAVNCSKMQRQYSDKQCNKLFSYKIVFVVYKMKPIKNNKPGSILKN